MSGDDDARDAHPADEWRLVYEGFDPAREGLRETLCTLGNGYVATRGASPDSAGDEVHYPGTYLAGGYNRLTTTIAGREVENEDLVNLPNWLPLTFCIDEEPWFRLDDAEILSCRQELDIRAGLLRRDLRVRDGAGRTTRWVETRLVSMAEPHLAGLEVALMAEDWSGRLTVRTALDGSVTNSGVRRYRDLAGRHLETQELDCLGTDTLFLHTRTSQSRLEVALAARTRMYRDGAEIDAGRQSERQSDGIQQDVTCEVRAGEVVTMEKIVAIHTSHDQAISEPGVEAKRTLGLAGRFDGLRAAHELAWQHLWDEFDIRLESHETLDTQLKVRVYIFHLLQTVSEHTIDLDAGVPARGWHGEAYRGHIFWDELFIFPFLTLRRPTLTQALLRYRYRRLPEARRAAREAGYQGAMFPWQSGSNGREESQRLHLNPRSGRWIPDTSYKQRHINAAIAYNVWEYHQATDDHEFLSAYGAEMMLEIARFWARLATYNEALDRYEIKGVMGPDEYHTGYPDDEQGRGLDNNAYTNVIAAWVLSRATDVLELLPKIRCTALCQSIGLGLDEIERWRDISRKLRVPFHDGGIISQFEGYGDLEELDWDAYREKYDDIQRLDRILEAEHDSTNRYKLSKQADVLMLFYLFSAEELGLLFEQLGYPFDQAAIPRNIDHYMARICHGSTLSRIAHAWVLARSDVPARGGCLPGSRVVPIYDVRAP